MLMYERRIENSVIKITKELKRFQVIRRIELEATDKQREPSPSLRDKAATQREDAFVKHGQDAHATIRQSTTRYTPVEKKDDLKKQTQFAVIQIGAKSYLKREYDNNPAGEVEENKANRSQFQAHSSLNGSDVGEIATAVRASQ
jgi:hypothetical protein